jgi:alkyl hydroperoxide reductase subunit AhpC
MLDPNIKDKEGLPLTCRAVFIVGPDKKLKLSLNYPASVGRNMDEIVRVIDALQLSAKYSVVRHPVHLRHGSLKLLNKLLRVIMAAAHSHVLRFCCTLHASGRTPKDAGAVCLHCIDESRWMQATPANWPNNHESIDAKGWAFLLPTVTPEDADKVGW